MFQHLNEKEREKLEKWMEGHKEENEGAIGGRYTYMVTPTSLGMVYKVKDNCTNEVLDLTDYDSW